MTNDSYAIPAAFIAQVSERLSAGKRVRRALPGWGRVHIDRQLPFLVVYRQPTRQADEGTDQLIIGQPAYIAATAHQSAAPGLAALVNAVAGVMGAAFGSFLLIEIWADPALPALREASVSEAEAALRRPVFRLSVPNDERLRPTVDRLVNELTAIRVGGLRSEVSRTLGGRTVPRRLPALLDAPALPDVEAAGIAIALRPIYRHPETDELLPLLLLGIVRDLNRALQRTFFTFTRTTTTLRPPYYQALGRRAVVKAVWAVDAALSQISDSFDLLLQSTPINTNRAWADFKARGFQRQPAFFYRPHQVDPALLKRQLWQVQIERVEDPTLQHLFREKQAELDTQLSMLQSMNTPRFLYGSLALYGPSDAPTLRAAHDLLDVIPPDLRETVLDRRLNARQFIHLARDHIDSYRALDPGFGAKVQEDRDISGLMVSQGNLLVGGDLRLPDSRIEALLSHEIGTHALTYYNGQQQRLKLLSTGLAGYDELQEGLAVLAEHLVDGLSLPRLRLLAARVIAAHSVADHADFVQTFRLLAADHGFPRRLAFGVTVRVHRGGGLTKDVVYLRGLVRLLHHLQREALRDTLFIGKIALVHLPIIEELRRRTVLQAPALTPHYLNTTQATARLQQIAQGMTVRDLTRRDTP